MYTSWRAAKNRTKEEKENTNNRNREIIEDDNSICHYITFLHLKFLRSVVLQFVLNVMNVEVFVNLDEMKK
jgi:hypothetical protein